MSLSTISSFNNLNIKNSIESNEQGTVQIEHASKNVLPNIDEIVEKIFQNEKAEYQENLRNMSWEPMYVKKDSEWEKEKQRYFKFEKYIRENQDEIPSWQIAGPLNYSMSLEQMKDVVTKKFKEMVSSGNLMTEKQLTKNHNRETFYPTTGRGGSNLTRIWGAEYLKSNLVDDTTLAVAEHFLIVDDSASEIEVEVWHGDGYPYVSVVNNAYVLSQKIEGERKAWEYRYSIKLDELGYVDFKDRGNIICDSKGKGWIVDTELMSFVPPNVKGVSSLQDYLKKRFKVLAGKEYSPACQIFKISIADLKLK